MADMTFKANLIPASNDYYNLGTATGAINKYWRLAVNNITSVPSTNLFGGICFTDSNTAVLSKINTSPFFNIRLQSNNWCAIELGKPREYSGFLHFWHKSSDYSTILYPKAPSTTQVNIQLPDESGLVALQNSANSGYVRKTGDTMTGDLHVTKSSATNTIVNVSNTKGNMSLLVADSGNRGIWDHTSSKWIIYTNGSVASSAYLFQSNATSSVTWIKGSHEGVFRCVNHPSTNGSFYPWLSGKTKSGAWSMGCLTGTSGENLYFVYGTDSNYNSSTNSTSNICFGYDGKVYGAVWNDYAEFRKENPEEKESQTPGRCVHELGNGALVLTTKRLERGCEIVSDTYGFAIGEDKDNGYTVPIASTGRVLAYPYESIEEFAVHIGWPVCSGPDGTVSIMTEEEEEKYPSRIIGTISEIPDYEEWGSGNVKVNGRVWIRIR